jgi:hypothetical protein
MLVDYEQARNSYRFRSVEASEHKEQLSFEMGFWSSFVHPLAHEQGQSALSALCGFCRAQTGRSKIGGNPIRGCVVSLA